MDGVVVEVNGERDCSLISYLEWGGSIKPLQGVWLWMALSRDGKLCHHFLAYYIATRTTIDDKRTNLLLDLAPSVE